MVFSHVLVCDEAAFSTWNVLNGQKHRSPIQTSNTIKSKLCEWVRNGIEWKVLTLTQFIKKKLKDVKWISIWIEMATCTYRIVHTSFESNRPKKSPREVTKISALEIHCRHSFLRFVRGVCEKCNAGGVETARRKSKWESFDAAFTTITVVKMRCTVYTQQIWFQLEYTHTQNPIKIVHKICTLRIIKRWSAVVWRESALK